MASMMKRVSSFFRIGRAQYLAGTDLSQNRYYEYPSIDGNPDPRKTRRLVRFREHKELGEYDQSTLPTQWLMWLRHTRKSAPTIEELTQDEERIRITQHNAWVLEQRDAQRRLDLEAKADAQMKERQLIEQETYAGPSQHRGGARVPTSTVTDKEAQREAAERVPYEEQTDAQHVVSHRSVDMEVWEASRRRVEEQDNRPYLSSSSSSSLSKEKERERARQLMSQSPLDAFDVTYVDEATRSPSAQRPTQVPRQTQTPSKPTQQHGGGGGGLNPRFGRQSGPGENWAPEEWQPSRPAHRRG